MIYMFLSNNPSSGDINSSNLPCLYFILTAEMKEISTYKAFFPAHETETITIS